VSMVGFCGSRSLPPPSSALVSRVVGAMLAAPGDRGVAVGCCVGADRAIISSVLAVPSSASRLSVFAAFGPVSPPWPAPRVSAPGASSSVSWPSGVGAACRAGASVRWWAGGGPAVPMAGRLASRSAALVSAVAASGPGCGLVAFVRDACPPHLLPATSPSAAFYGHASGSWGSLALAAGLGLPVIVFPVSPSGYGDAAGTLLPAFWPGLWTPLSSRAWAGGFRFVANPPLQDDLFGPES